MQWIKALQLYQAAFCFFAFSLETYTIWLHLFPMGINKATQMIYNKLV